jgi:hypothetical protein
MEPLRWVVSDSFWVRFSRPMLLKAGLMRVSVTMQQMIFQINKMQRLLFRSAFFGCTIEAVMQEINCKGTSKNGYLLQIRRRTIPSFGNPTIVEPRSGSSRVVSSQNGKPQSPSYGSTGSVCFITLNPYVALIALVS